MDEFELARQVFRVLWEAGPQGLDRDALAHALGVPDREMREAVELCAKLAARPSVPGARPEVVGFDPMTRRYHIANSVEQADRIISYALSYINSGLERVRAYCEARTLRWGEIETPQATQQALFEAERRLER
ncbi:hypothetical protein Mesil_1903 [Allomeiothermus silvanus DSM 9946]|uniref:Uncharacterized protein n=1 Tax=Allomeiothermus silvanus (strain ATCC 700542 / DSM 9946 / NBRC 106475 / NCIMB 13440 / VI-R2) TaxID=526227 RepID=D7BGG2_ALLS1|nr:hypothetical protein [Allomeiothermus silvanus]ADH63778.1 hypothetical protein Mesil_1903 [Allomeiothermus silvanus DSM 9946]